MDSSVLLNNLISTARFLFSLCFVLVVWFFLWGGVVWLIFLPVPHWLFVCHFLPGESVSKAISNIAFTMGSLGGTGVLAAGKQARSTAVSGKALNLGVCQHKSPLDLLLKKGES